MKTNLNLCFGRRPYFLLLESLSWGHVSLHTKFIILAIVVFEKAMKKTLNLCVGRQPLLKPHVLFPLVRDRRAWINFIILDFVVFEIAMKETLNLCFGRRSKLKPYFFPS